MVCLVIDTSMKILSERMMKAMKWIYSQVKQEIFFYKLKDARKNEVVNTDEVA